VTTPKVLLEVPPSIENPEYNPKTIGIVRDDYQGFIVIEITDPIVRGLINEGYPIEEIFNNFRVTLKPVHPASAKED
jgi:hypothetical protein